MMPHEREVFSDEESVIDERQKTAYFTGHLNESI
jgi:hypothetical protein